MTAEPPSPVERRPRRVLCVDDDVDYLTILRTALRLPGIETLSASSTEEALDRIRREGVDLLLTDIHMPGRSGYELIRQARAQGCTAPVLVLTAQGSIEGAVQALQLGARDYLLKPVDPERLRRSVEQVLRDPTTPWEGGAATGEGWFHGMLGRSAAMREVFTRVERVGRTSATVLVTGESGTGKELVARAVHACSTRAQGPFVPVHTGAIPRELIASELFGHERGAFTGAVSAAEGKFDAAARGTLFLDEIGTMDLAVQVALLRVLESYRFTRVGGHRERVADVRIVAATNRDLGELVAAGQFREDLLYRLDVVTVALPPLRARQHDIAPMAEHFLRHFAHRHGTWARRLTRRAVERLCAHAWPGNVRELRNAMEQTALFAPRELVDADSVQMADGWARRPRSEAPSRRQGAEGARDEATDAPSDAAHGALDPNAITIPVGTSLADAERIIIERTLARFDGNKLKAARVLGISRRGLYNKLELYRDPSGHASTSATDDDP